MIFKQMGGLKALMSHKNEFFLYFFLKNENTLLF